MLLHISIICVQFQSSRRAHIIHLYFFMSLFLFFCKAQCLRLWYLLKELLVSGLFLGSTSGSLGLDGAQLGLDGRRVRVDLVCGLQVLDGGVFVLEADAGETTTVQSLGTVSVLGAGNGECRSGAADGVGPSFGLDAHKSAVVVEDEADGVERSLGGGGFVVEVRVFVEVADTLFVLFESEVEVARLEGLVAKVLAGGCDFEDLLGGQGLLVGREVVGEVFERVAGGIRLLDVGLESFFAGELAAVGDQGFFLGLVAGGRAEVLDLADDGLAVEDFTEDNVLAVEVGGGNGGEEELRAVGVWDVSWR